MISLRARAWYTTDDLKLGQAAVDAIGWHNFTTGLSQKIEIEANVLSVARALGAIVPGRHRQLVEEIIPRHAQAAYTSSLSERHGLDPLPLHTDTAHWGSPCHYLVMACVQPGTDPTPTILLDSSKVPLTNSEEEFGYSETFIVQNGRNSFYGYIREKNRQFTRVDEGCMKALTSEGAVAIAAYSAHRNFERLHFHHWQVGDILVIDNWRMLHGRGYDGPTCSDRLLLRTMVQ